MCDIKTAAIVLVTACTLATPLLAADIVGRVVDAGLSTEENGIAGAMVEIVSDQVVLGSGFTDAKGDYKVTVPSPLRRMAVRVSKTGYINRPTVLDVRNANPQAPVRLSQRGKPPEYYRVVADTIMAAAKADTAGTDSLPSKFLFVLSLPASDKAAVLGEVKQRNLSVHAAFAKASDFSEAVVSATAKLPASVGEGVEIYPNWGEVGTVRLTGTVPSDSAKDQIARVVKSSAMNTKIENDIKVDAGRVVRKAPGSY